MRRIAAANATPGGLFRDANPGTGQKATSFNAQWANDVQESLMAVIEARGGGESAAYDALYRAMVDIAHPVTSYLILERVDSPAVDWPWQTWVEVSGRVLVGLDEAQTEFNVVGKQGGSKDVVVPRDGWSNPGGPMSNPTTGGRLVIGSGSGEINETLESLAHAAANQTIAGGALQPSRVVRMWRRTA